MATVSTKKKILLAVRSPIFAPLYLARLDSKNAFDQIEFEYRLQPRRQIVRDPLVFDVISPHEECRDCIGAFGDPFRALIKYYDDVEQPVIFSNFINHQSYWLASDESELDVVKYRELPYYFDNFIVQPSYMSGYSVVGHFLEKECGLDSLDAIGSFMYDRTFAGHERSFYNSFRRRPWNSNKRYGYLTTNPMAMLRGETVILKDFLKTEYCRNTLMTSFIIGQKAREDNDKLFNNIRDALNDAIEHIYQDPIGSAVRLTEYSDNDISFHSNYIKHSSLVTILEKLVSEKVYASGLKISNDQINRGIHLREHFRKLNRDHDKLRPVNEINEYIDSEILSNETSCAPQSLSLPNWVLDVTTQFFESIERPKDRRNLLMSMTALVIALIAATMSREATSYLNLEWPLIPIKWLSIPPEILTSTLTLLSLIFTLGLVGTLVYRGVRSLFVYLISLAVIVFCLWLLFIEFTPFSKDSTTQTMLTLAIPLVLSIFTYNASDIDGKMKYLSRIRARTIMKLRIKFTPSPRSARLKVCRTNPNNMTNTD